ncbi:hypothetical protein ACWD01_13070 [Streptomyces sp. NPDC002835]
MILNDTQLRWHSRVVSLARKSGWSVFEPQLTRSLKQHDPSMVLTKGSRLLVVWLRTGRPRADRRPPVDRYATGVETYLWYPSDEAQMALALTGLDAGDGDGC